MCADAWQGIVVSEFERRQLMEIAKDRGSASGPECAPDPVIQQE
jgi:hypothetical protein